MRTPIATIGLLLFTLAAFASEIREFDLKTIERLGNELTRSVKRPIKAQQLPNANAQSKQRSLR